MERSYKVLLLPCDVRSDVGYLDDRLVSSTAFASFGKDWIKGFNEV